MLSFENITVTPEIAKLMLESNTNNYRKIKQDLVHKYARAMMQGMWHNNGEPIVFDEDGTLKNGQHRLCAVVESGCDVPMLIVKGVNRDINTWDEGSQRTINEKAKAENIHLNNMMFAVVNTIMAGFSKVRIGNDEKCEYARRNYNNLRKAELIGIRGKKNGVLRKSPCIAAIYCAVVLKAMPDKELEAFCYMVNSGIPTEGYIWESALKLRDTLSEGFRNVDGTRAINSSTSNNRKMFETTWQALMAFKEGRKTKRRFVPNGCGEDVLKMVREAEKEEVA